MSKYSSSSLLSDVTFEEIMLEAEVSSDKAKRNVSTHGKGMSSSGSKSSNPSVEFSIIKNYGKLSQKKRAATFAYVDWGGYERYDLRSWSEDYTTPYKGISFTKEEVSALHDMLSCYTHRTYTKPQYVCDMGKTKAKVFYNVCKLSTSKVRGVTWNKQVSIVDWGYGQKYDFRKWTENYDKCGKGICLTQDEVDELLRILGALQV